MDFTGFPVSLRWINIIPGTEKNEHIIEWMNLIFEILVVLEEMTCDDREIYLCVSLY